MKQNYQLMLEKEIEKIKKDGSSPSLLLHACCAPCSSFVLESLSEVFKITLLYYNPNITPKEEYDLRAEEIVRLSGKYPSQYIICDYSPERFIEISKGLEKEPEGGERCEKCFRLRLSEAAKIAKERGFDYFTTSLSISPHKNAQLLNSIGKELSENFGIKYLFSDFKKKNGFLRSCELSEKFGLYRQDYCGCAFSKAELIERNAKKDCI